MGARAGRAFLDRHEPQGARRQRLARAQCPQRVGALAASGAGLVHGVLARVDEAHDAHLGLRAKGLRLAFFENYEARVAAGARRDDARARRRERRADDLVEHRPVIAKVNRARVTTVGGEQPERARPDPGRATVAIEIDGRHGRAAHLEHGRPARAVRREQPVGATGPDAVPVGGRRQDREPREPAHGLVRPSGVARRALRGRHEAPHAGLRRDPDVAFGIDAEGRDAAPEQPVVGAERLGRSSVVTSQRRNPCAVPA